MKRKIMLVDDNKDLLYMLKIGLERLTDQYKILTAESAEEFFDKLEKNEKPDLILLDIMMPKTTGWDVLAKLRSENKWEKIPVIFLTAVTDNASKGLGTLTSEGYISKPFDIEDIIKQIDHYFETMGDK